MVLQGRPPEKYYRHVLMLHDIISRCLQFEIQSDEIDELEQLVVDWMDEYKRYSITDFQV